MDGTYHLRHASSLNGKVVYKKQGRGARSFYLSRDPDTLRWKVTDSEADLGTSRALLSTNEGAVLPFGSTLDWQYHQRGGFVEAPNVEVVGELPVTAAETSTSYMHSAQCGGHLESLLDRAAVQNEKMAPGGGGVAMVTWIRNKDGSKSYHVMVDNPDGEHDLCLRKCVRNLLPVYACRVVHACVIVLEHALKVSCGLLWRQPGAWRMSTRTRVHSARARFVFEAGVDGPAGVDGALEDRAGSGIHLRKRSMSMLLVMYHSLLHGSHLPPRYLISSFSR